MPDGHIRVSFPAVDTTGTGYSGVKRYYTLKCRTNLLAGGWNDVMALTRTVGDGTMKVLDEAPSPTSQAYYRLNAWLQAAVPPVANAGTDQFVVDADSNGVETVTLDGSGSWDPNGDPFTYSWSTNGVEIATGVNPTVSLPLGVHTITLTVDDSVSGPDTDTVDINVSVPLEAYPYTMPISFPGYDGSETLVDFPVLVKLGNGLADGLSYAGFTSPAGFDLRFTTPDGQTELNYEIESWNTGGVSTVLGAASRTADRRHGDLCPLGQRGRGPGDVHHQRSGVGQRVRRGLASRRGDRIATRRDGEPEYGHAVKRGHTGGRRRSGKRGVIRRYVLRRWPGFALCAGGARRVSTAVVCADVGGVVSAEGDQLAHTDYDRSQFMRFRDSGRELTGVRWTSTSRAQSGGIPACWRLDTNPDGNVGANWKTLTSSAAVPLVAGQWTHISATKDGTTGRLYQDGIRIADDGTAVSSTLNSWDDYLSIGLPSTTHQELQPGRWR